MAAQLLQQRFHLFLFLFRERQFAPRLLSLVVNGGPVDFLGSSCFLACMRSGRLFGDGLLVLRNTASGVPICQVRRRFLEGCC